MNIPFPVLDKIAKLIPRLASPSDAEVLATVRVIRAVLGRHGLDLHDLAEGVLPPAPPAERSEDCAEHIVWCRWHVDRLSDREADFIRTIDRLTERRPDFYLSDRQMAWLFSISDRLTREACHA